MIFDQKPLREITEADLRAEIAAGLTEHLYLEYKQEIYGRNDAGKKEFLLDICQFANGEGGFLFVGVPEMREGGQPTGVPDPDGQLGIEVENHENVLLRFDAQIAANIHERIRVESCAIPIAGGRVVLAFHVPDSTSRPHGVKLQGEHLYFPNRRERHRVYLDVREMKEMTMRTASQLERAKSALKESLSGEPRPGRNVYFQMGLIPVFFKDFLIDVREQSVQDAFLVFDVRTLNRQFSPLAFSFEGLVRDDGQRDRTTLCRNGLLKCTCQITYRRQEDRLSCAPVWTDQLLRNFVIRAQALTQAAGIAEPFLLKVAIHSPEPVVAFGPGMIRGVDEEVGRLEAGYWPLPEMHVDTLEESVDRLIRPICDCIHQTFGCEGSPRFDVNGNWVRGE